MFDNASSRVKMDCTEDDTKWKQAVAARYLKQMGKKLGYNGPMQPSISR